MQPKRSQPSLFEQSMSAFRNDALGAAHESGSGPSRQFAAMQKFSRFQGEADMDGRETLMDSDAHDLAEIPFHPVQWGIGRCSCVAEKFRTMGDARESTNA